MFCNIRLNWLFMITFTQLTKYFWVVKWIIWFSISSYGEIRFDRQVFWITSTLVEQIILAIQASNVHWSFESSVFCLVFYNWGIFQNHGMTPRKGFIPALSLYNQLQYITMQRELLKMASEQILIINSVCTGAEGKCYLIWQINYPPNNKAKLIRS